MPRQHVLRYQADVVVQRFADALEQVVEHRPHCQHRWPGINTAHLPHLAARCGCPVDHRNLGPGMHQRQRGGQPADTGADHDNGAFARRGRIRGPHVMIVDSDRSTVQYDLQSGVRKT